MRVESRARRCSIASCACSRTASIPATLRAPTDTGTARNTSPDQELSLHNLWTDDPQFPACGGGAGQGLLRPETASSPPADGRTVRAVTGGPRYATDSVGSYSTNVLTEGSRFATDSVGRYSTNERKSRALLDQRTSRAGALRPQTASSPQADGRTLRAASGRPRYATDSVGRYSTNVLTEGRPTY